MHADSFLTTKYTSFNRSLHKTRSYSFQHHSVDNARPNLAQKKEIENNRQQHHSVNILQQIPQNISIITLFSKPIVEQLLLRQSDLYMKQFKIQLSLILDQGNLQQFQALICMTADILLKIKDFNNACYYYNQYRILNTLTKNHSEKAVSFIGLANCATEVKMNKEALLLLKKGLQYSWLCKEHEIQIYERMAINYYYLGQIEDQLYFHERGLLGVFEAEESPIKKFSCEALRDQIRKNVIEIKTLCPQLLNYLNLPILSENELNNKSQNCIRRSHTKKQIIYTAQEQLEVILRNCDEFQFQINTPRYQRLIQYESQKKQTDEFRHPLITKTSYSKEKRVYDITDSTIYKLPFEMQVNNRIQHPYIFEDINSKMYKQLRTRNPNQKFGLRNKVLLNHQNREDFHYQKNGACLYRQIQAIFKRYAHLFT
ncbi:unnamed protein product (macronuclear) [Paramecium tetraurelia]|uniref:BRO1 domain-containing protein n=1 Tax=Paramecium tetraurelia TaxID=5888 RepID=A0DZ40_PARTE|nr:uncharacterized protein GSPATT00003276001 [Paramecium tetraurelia]CAK88307.1 unnamed protein product [Paramecium tetraurelia]|eukprot:XP_001455704.1 hypothetical protein (macronuclear) [Paramecium tetraurelia strain d4-2]